MVYRLTWNSIGCPDWFQIWSNFPASYSRVLWLQHKPLCLACKNLKNTVFEVVKVQNKALQLLHVSTHTLCHALSMWAILVYVGCELMEFYFVFSYDESRLPCTDYLFLCIHVLPIFIELPILILWFIKQLGCFCLLLPRLYSLDTPLEKGINKTSVLGGKA